MGIGRMLYEELERILVKQSVINVYAGIASPVEEDEYLTQNSEFFQTVSLHEMIEWIILETGGD